MHAINGMKKDRQFVAFSFQLGINIRNLAFAILSLNSLIFW
jgi:hypothetical protein